MKIFLAVILILSTVEGYSQKKGKVDPKDVTIDSLTSVTTILTTQLDSTTKSAASLSMELDSVSKDLTRFKEMYTIIKEQVVLRDFDPAEMGTIIDSLKAGRDATFSGLSASSKSMADSVASVSYTHLRAHETVLDLVFRLLLEKKKYITHYRPPLIIRLQPYNSL